jgi:flagellar capping protein FliD
VDDYNKLIDSLNEKYSEQKYSDYKPLTEAQKKGMKDEEIEKWEEKAKSGLLYHNDTVRDLMSAMREAVYTKVDAVDSEYNTLSAIGITSSNVKGHLTLDETKLNKALAADPDCVYQLFASDQDSTYIAGSTNKNKITSAQQRQDYANTGVANRLYNVMTNHMSKISDIAGTSKDANDQSYLGKLITDMQTKMKSFKTQMSAYESKLFKRYDAMEVALSRLNMQLGYIAGSFS